MSRGPLRYGIVILPEDRRARTRERGQAAERLGFDHAWTYGAPVFARD